ncbi:DNA-methyltransferase [Enterococcus aquimarinus]|nr:site-specific DNA-methyltransferase [Enterococcus aquimarinus]
MSDVPYNISGDDETKDGKIVKKGNPYMKGKVGLDFGDWDKGNFIVDDWIRAVTPKVKDNGQIIIFNSFKNISKMAITLFEEGWMVKGTYYWHKPNPMPHMPEIFPLSATEQYILVVKDLDNYTVNTRKGNEKMVETGRLDASSHEDQKKRFHTTQKPLSMWKSLVEIHSNEGDIVLDSFSGSAVNAVACIELGRNFIGTELDDDYFQKGNDRIEKALKLTPPLF